jgi:subtilisin family serine protease
VRRGARVGFRLVAVLLFFVCVVLDSPPAISDSVRGQEWILPALRVAQAQRLATGKGVTVAVIDTGVVANQVDLRGKGVAP